MVPVDERADIEDQGAEAVVGHFIDGRPVGIVDHQFDVRAARDNIETQSRDW